jgi:hypothetical protein
MKRALLRAATAAALLLIVVGPAEATGPTTITFSEHAAGTVIDTEYALQGVRFGKAADLGAQALAGAWDCGPPQVKELTSDGTPPRLGQAPVCGGRSGTVAAFTAPRKTIRLVVEATPSTDRQADVLAYGANGALLASVRVSASRSPVAIERASADVAYLAVQLTGEGPSALLFDDLVFDHVGDPLQLNPRDVTASVGVERTDNVALLTDADPTATPADYAVTIDWGDGRSSPGRLAPTGGGYDVVGTHAYGATGTFVVRTTVEKSNGVRASTTSSARVVDRPDLAVSVSPTSSSVPQGRDARYTVTVTPLAGFTGSVSLSLAGASGTFAPASLAVPGSSRLTVATSASTAPGSYPLTITATSGSLSRTGTATLTVAKAAPAPVARLTVPRPSPALSVVALDARGTTGAAWFLWDVDGDRQPDVACGKKTPVLGVRLRTPGLRTVSLTAVAADGSTSVERRTLGIRKRPRASGDFTEVATCLRDARPYLQGRACAEKVVFGVVEAKGCFTADGDSLVARGPVRLNGIGFFPRPGATIVLSPQAGQIASAAAEISLGKIRIRAAGPFALSLRPPAPGPAPPRTLGKRRGSVRLLTFQPNTQLPELGGFALTGEAEISLLRTGARYVSRTKARLALPAVFSLFGVRPSGATTFEADNDRGLVVDDLTLRVPEAHLGAIRLTDLSFEYKARGNPEFRCSRRWWKATANVFLGGSGGGGFRLAPEPRRNGVAFCSGAFRSAGGEVVFDPPVPRPQIFPSVELRKLGFEIETDPWLVVGTGTVSIGRLVDVAGGLVIAFPSPAAPYVVPPNEAQGTLARLRGRVFTGPTVAVGGSFTLPVGPLRIPFANAYAAYSYPDYVAAGGSARLVLPGMSANVGVDGELLVGKALFSFRGFGELCLAGLGCVLRADAWVTSTGVVACGTIAGELHPGAGYRWGAAWPDVWLVDGCKPSPYWVNVRPSALARVPYAATTSFTVARGERAKNVRLEGAGGAPRVEVRGPSGEVVSSASGDFAAGRTIRILRHDAGKVTWVGVAPAAPGRYTVTTLPGSTDLARVAATREVDEHVRATVAGAGRSRVLRYDVARLPGRRVTFFERGRSSYRQLGQVTGGKGALRFAPAPGPRGLRQVVARVELDGVPTPDRVVARFHAAGPPPIGRPARLDLRRRASTVTASWSAAPEARRYVVVVRLRSGEQRVLRMPAARRSVRLAGIPATQPGAVTVRGVGGSGVLGPPATARFVALRALPSPFRPFAKSRGARATG